MMQRDPELRPRTEVLLKDLYAHPCMQENEQSEIASMISQVINPDVRLTNFNFNFVHKTYKCFDLS